MELNSTDESGAEEIPSDAKSLEQVIAESKQTILEGGDRRAGPGRKPKYHSDEARKAARNEQNRRYKEKNRGGQAESSTSEENAPTRPRVREVHPEPTPAGLAPYLNELADIPVFRLRARFSLTETEFPGLKPDAKEMLVAQADLTIGVFCPNAVNNKWIMLASLLGTATMIYAGLGAQAEAIFAAKNAAAEGTKLQTPTPGGLVFPTSTV